MTKKARKKRAVSLAKQRYETLVKQRETCASAVELTQAAAALVEAPVIPANRLVELNQAWELLPHDFIEDQDCISTFLLIRPRHINQPWSAEHSAL